MKKCILSSLLIHVVFWSVNGAVGKTTPPLPDPISFYTALTLAGKETVQSAALELEKFFQSPAGQLAQIIPFEEQYPKLELRCPYCDRTYATDSSSRKVQEQLKSAFKKHRWRHKKELYCCPICKINYFQDARALEIHIKGTCGENLTEEYKKSLLNQLEEFKTEYTRDQLEASISLETQQRRSKYKRI
jgi:hypothetical protein